MNRALSNLNLAELSSLLSMGAGAASTAFAFLFLKNPFVSSTRARLERIESQILMISEKVDHIIGVGEKSIQQAAKKAKGCPPIFRTGRSRAAGSKTSHQRYPYASSRSPSAKDRRDPRSR